MNKLIFDIETIPDVQLGRRMLGLDASIEDKQVADIMYQQRRTETNGSDFLPYEQHRVVAISAVLRREDKLKVWSLGDPDSSEAEIIRRFYEGIEKYTPDLVSWNGSGFDLPCLQYRALQHSIQAPRYWETGNDDQSFRYNNYRNRYHERHCDLMDVLSSFQNRARVSLHNMARSLGFPGKLDMSGAHVWDQYRSGRIDLIRNYCETDVLNTFLILLRFELMRGHLTHERHAEEVERVKVLLRNGRKDQPHFAEFLRAWEASA